MPNKRSKKAKGEKGLSDLQRTALSLLQLARILYIMVQAEQPCASDIFNSYGLGDSAATDQLECASIISLASEGSDQPSLNGEDAATIYSIIERVNTACEDLTEKRPEARIKALNFILESYQLHCLCLDDFWNYSSTFQNGIEYIIKKGKPQDQALAADCLAVFCFQFNTSSIVEWFAKFRPLLDPVIRDASINVAYRSACITAIALLQFFAGRCDVVLLTDLMGIFESIFRGSCLKGDGKAPVLISAVTSLHIASLRAWALLFSILSASEISTIGPAILPIIISLLKTNSVDMRIMSGETAVLVYERIRNEVEPRFKGPHYNELVRLLGELATDWTKHRSKSDLKKQRRSFRELLDALTSSDTSETSISFGTEVLTLSSSMEHHLYNFLCYLLKGGVTRHLKENCQVRDLFGLGPPVVVTHSLLDRRSVRDQKRVTNAVASKLRTQKLGNHRDQRSNVLSLDDV